MTLSYVNTYIKSAKVNVQHTVCSQYKNRQMLIRAQLGARMAPSEARQC